MRPIPIPDIVLQANGGRRHVIGEADPTRDDVRPVEYLVTPSSLYPGRHCFTTIVVLEEADLEAIRRGATHLALTLDGAEVPWAVEIVEGL